MKPLDNIQISLSQIKHIIQSNADLRKLIVNDSLDPLSGSTVSYSEAEGHIFNAAIFDITEPPYDKNTLITITLIIADKEETRYDSMIRVSVITRSTLWEISNNKIRPLEVASLIIKDLDNLKLQTSQKLFFDNLEFMVLDGNINGYGLTFELIEGSGLDDEF